MTNLNTCDKILNSMFNLDKLTVIHIPDCNDRKTMYAFFEKYNIPKHGMLCEHLRYEYRCKIKCWECGQYIDIQRCKYHLGSCDNNIDEYYSVMCEKCDNDPTCFDCNYDEYDSVTKQNNCIIVGKELLGWKPNPKHMPSKKYQIKEDDYTDYDMFKVLDKSDKYVLELPEKIPLTKQALNNYVKSLLR